jgi:hypothetical protein
MHYVHLYEKLLFPFYGSQPHYGPGAESASNRIEYQESSWVKKRPARRADNLVAICEPNV